MNESLSGKAALVTGGARRVGAAITRRLHAAGANVLLHYRDSEKVFALEKTSLQIRSVAEDKPDEGENPAEGPGPGFRLSVEDAEELALLLRPGNEVEIRAVGP